MGEARYGNRDQLERCHGPGNSGWMDGRKYWAEEGGRSWAGVPIDRTYLLVLPALIAKRPDRHTLERAP